MSEYEKFCKQFIYDEETGKLYWATKGCGRAKGSEAGSLNDRGYMVVQVNYQKYKVSRIIWLIKTGKWPVNEIDHINRKRYDNRFSNFRDATPKENSNNRATSKCQKLSVASLF